VIEIPTQSPVPTKFTAFVRGRVTAAGVFEGSARFEFQGLAELSVRRTFLDSTDAEKEAALKSFNGITSASASASVRQIVSSDPADLSKPFQVACEINDRDFFPTAKQKTKVGSPLHPLVAQIRQALEVPPQPEKPYPVERVSITDDMDLIIDSSLTTTTGMPVHLKAVFGTFDSEYSYRDGHLTRKRSLELNGSSIAPTEWNEVVEFMRSTAVELGRGFELERHTAASGLSGSRKALQEGAAAYTRRDYEGAKRAFLEATRLDPKSTVAWNDLGRVYVALQDFDGAEKAYQRLIEINPADKSGYNSLGVVYRNLQREDEAIAMFRKQIAINPRDPYAHDNLATSLGRKKLWTEAAAEEAIAVEITPEDSAKWSRLGMEQLKSGRSDEGRKSFGKALELAHGAMTENAIAYELADAGVDLARAWQLVTGALDPQARQICQPEKIEDNARCTQPIFELSPMLDTAGWVLYRQGDFAGAERYLRSAYAIAPLTVMSLHLSAALLKLGRVDEALKYFAAAASSPNMGEVRGEFAKALGGNAELDARLKLIPAVPKDSVVRVSVLVDDQGKVLEAKPGDAPAEVLKQAETMSLTPIAWPGHSLLTVRVVEFRKQGAEWVIARSYMWKAPP